MAMCMPCEATCVLVANLAGDTCLVTTDGTSTVADVANEAAKLLDLPDGRHVLCHGSMALQDHERFPEHLENVVIVTRARPDRDTWNGWVNAVLDDDSAFARLESECPDILDYFGVEFCRDVVSRDRRGTHYAALPARFRDNFSVTKAAVKKSYAAFEFASSRLRADKSLALLAVQQYRRGCPCCEPLPIHHVAEELRADYDVVSAAIQWEPLSLDYASTALRQNEDMIEYMRMLEVDLEETQDGGLDLRVEEHLDRYEEDVEISKLRSRSHRYAAKEKTRCFARRLSQRRGGRRRAPRGTRRVHWRDSYVNADA
eukprot:TRINITY_DN45510_c0_g1_i1.p1 TRINITY_DN45510_c0_g1~~TRINITY_DN45510_c0_g1_i1.p1  ORF type:complete len:336 (+),score=36.44 TRINITY_DN45510_c0_g1_i1:64-1008(+)